MRRRDLGEADRLLTIFTRRFGKVKAVAKGCRRPRSRMAGHLEPLNVADFILWRREGRDLAVVSAVELKERHRSISDHFQIFAAAQVAAELMDRSLGEDEAHPKLFVMFLQFLRALRRPEHATQALLAFVVRAAEDFGYAVSLDLCAECHSRLPAAGEAWLEYELGGVVCPNCSRDEPRSGEKISGAVMTALRAAASRPPRTASPECAAAGVRAIDRLLGYHQDRSTLNAERLLGVMALSS